jgi:hypothetical protein
LSGGPRKHGQNPATAGIAVGREDHNIHATSLDSTAGDPPRAPWANYPLHPVACARPIGDYTVATHETSGPVPTRLRQAADPDARPGPAPGKADLRQGEVIMEIHQQEQLRSVTIYAACRLAGTCRPGDGESEALRCRPPDAPSGRRRGSGARQGGLRPRPPSRPGASASPLPTTPYGSGGPGAGADLSTWALHLASAPAGTRQRGPTPARSRRSPPPDGRPRGTGTADP